MTETLRHVEHRKWYGYAEVTPSVVLQHTPNGTTYFARDGKVTMNATNLHDVVGGVRYAWPQEASWYYLDALDPRGGPSCNGHVYLGTNVYARMHNLAVEFRRDSETVSVTDSALFPGGTWHVRIV